MITVVSNIKEGDMVYAWFSPFNEKANKRPAEHEFKVSTYRNGHLGLKSTDGGYEAIFQQQLLDTWFGNVRKA